MDRTSFQHPQERQLGLNQTAPPPTTHASQFPPPTTQPPIHVPFPDPFQANRDPFLSGTGRRGSLGLSSRAWPSPQGLVTQHQQPLSHQQHHHHHHLSPPQPLTQNHSLPPPPPNGVAMAQQYDFMRRGSVGAASSPPQHAGVPLEPPPPPSFAARNMPPPSPPQNAPPFHHLGSAPRGPPTASPFPGVRDLSSHRPGMSISAILGGNEDRRANGSPRSPAVAPSPMPTSMQPPSPARARASSMRESSERNTVQGFSPQRAGIFGEPARTGSEPRRDGLFTSPQVRRDYYGFRAFQAPAHQHAHHNHAQSAPARPNSQPVESVAALRAENSIRRGPGLETSTGMFRTFGEPPVPPRSSEGLQRQDRPAVLHDGVSSHPQDRSVYGSPQIDRDGRIPGSARFQLGTANSATREDLSSESRPALPLTMHPALDTARESIEDRTQAMRRQPSQPSPPASGKHDADERSRNGFADRPLTFEERHKMLTPQDDQHRKEIDSSVHRAILNISPELGRRGRNSPLPQAVQGAQPRHIGPGGDNPGIKMEFGRMFSGLGSGVGSTPNPSHPLNGTTTPSRTSSARHLENGDLVRSAVAELNDRRADAKSATKTGRRNARRSRDYGEQFEGDGLDTPDLPRGNKRTKTAHPTHHHHHHVHPHYHHHHHREPGENGIGVHGMVRVPSNPAANANVVATPAHHHHHHHAHPAQHHHHAPRAVPPARKPSVTVVSRSVLNEVANKPRRHLGSQLYTTEVSLPPAGGTLLDSKIKFSSKMKPIPVFEGKENCTFTVRVPRFFLTSSDARPHELYNLEEICKRRQLWGTDIYTDDTDVIAAAVHSGWLKGDFGELNDDLREVCDTASEHDTGADTPLALEALPARPVKVPEGYDAHVTVLLLPPLESYASTNQCHVWSREWNKTHDGMSYMIHRIDFVDEGPSSRYLERGGAARKNRIASEEAARREAAAGLLMFANGNTVRVGA